MSHYGFVRVGAASPLVQVGDCERNTKDILEMLGRAEAESISVLVFPEMCLTGYTCADLFQNHTLLRAALDALVKVVSEGSEVFSGLAVLGLPLVVDDQIFNCAAVFHRGEILGIVPKSFIPNYKEFYELRWFARSVTAASQTVMIDGDEIPFGTHLLFEAENIEGLVVGVEICEDLWMPIPPTSFQATHGATILLNLSASNEFIGKMQYRRQLVVNQSGRCIAGYVYAGCGISESTTDVVFSGHCLIAESAALLAESERFQLEPVLLSADVDLDHLRLDRLRTNGFSDSTLYYEAGEEYVRVPFELERRPKIGTLRRHIESHPFVPRGKEQLEERCQEIFLTQTTGLGRRLQHIGAPPVTIGISGGLDSTLALLVTCKTYDRLGADRKKIKAFTMPGFGTSQRTLSNSLALMNELGVTPIEVDIRQLCLEQMRALKHQPFGIDLTGLSVEDFMAKLKEVPPGSQDLVFENIQARMRTGILMNSGFVVGTSDVSELALGWTTYNGDHMSMYNPNVSIPKTLVKFLVKWVAEHEFAGKARRILLDIVDTKISPELLPTTGEGEIGQSTEAAIGPYELHDFFLYHFVRFGAPPEKILFLAQQAQFDKPYSKEEIAKWLRVFIRRFFANQFKRSCLPDGPKVGSISLSPRGDWRMPSDAKAALWLKWAEEED